MIKLLFWNLKDIYNKERLNFLNDSGKEYDILILAEAQGNDFDTKISGFSLMQPLQTNGTKWIKFFKKNANNTFSLKRINQLFSNRIGIASLEINGKKDIDLYGVHLKSKLGIDDKTQLLMNSKASVEIFDSIKQRHDRLLLIGDFNHNPFEPFMNSHLTINSIPNKKIAKTLKYRTCDYLHKPIFYNPMWNFLGDYDLVNQVEKYNGTYFFKNDRHSFIDHIHWNLLDQVLVSESICDCINPSDITIITNYNDSSTGRSHVLADDSFFSSNKSYLNPDYSNHLPISFIIDDSKLE